MFWQRLTTRRSLTAEPIEPRWCARGGGLPRRSAHVPLVIREPETGCWDAQASTAMTVAAVREGDAGWAPERVLASLAALAAEDDLLVVFGSNGRALQNDMVAGLRASLPRKQVVTVPVRHRHGQLLRDAALVERLLDTGQLPIVVTPANVLHDVTAEIAGFLCTDRVLRVLHTIDGADLYPVWQRAAEVSVS